MCTKCSRPLSTYSIIGQGRTLKSWVLKSKIERRVRYLALPHAKFRYRKNEAERWLKNTEANLERLRDTWTFAARRPAGKRWRQGAEVSGAERKVRVFITSRTTCAARAIPCATSSIKYETARGRQPSRRGAATAQPEGRKRSDAGTVLTVEIEPPEWVTRSITEEMSTSARVHRRAGK